MKLRVAPAREGFAWFRLGVRTFLRRPLALMGLFFINIVVLSVLAAIPAVGIGMALLLVPSTTVAMMLATEEAHQGRFPLPGVLVAPFRGGPRLLRAMFTLGVVYCVGILLSLAMSSLVDGGQLFRLYTEGPPPAGTPTAVAPVDELTLQMAKLVFVGCVALLSLPMWHAPALAYWHGMGAAKSMFFSTVACLRNFKAFALYGLAWMGLMLVAVQIALYVAVAVGNQETFADIAFPAMMLISAMCVTSVYFTYQACFQFTSEESP